MAETQVGLSRHELACMSLEGCSASFAISQRDKFLDTNMRMALDRIEAEAALREAGIENLETCPFCPYAAVRRSLPFLCLFRVPAMNLFHRILVHITDFELAGVPTDRGEQGIPLLKR